MSTGTIAQLLSSVTAANSAPTVATDGVARPVGHSKTKEADLLLQLSRTSGTATFVFNLWGYHPTQAKWHADIIQTGTITITADKNFTRRIEGINRFSRYYLELETITGTGASVDDASLSVDPDAS